VEVRHSGSIAYAGSVVWNLLALLAVLALATAVGVLVRRNSGHFRGAPRAAGPAAAAPGGAGVEAGGDAAGTDPSGTTIDPADLPHPLGERATLLQFSSAFCAPCRATRRVLGEVASVVPGVTHIEIDAEHNLGLVRSLGVLRTPTTIVVDAEGREVSRATGAPTKHEALAAVGRAVEEAPTTD
jgi:thiol-disulfide isomerase/thioredoxin